jgi:hypothetical protein
MVRKTLLDYAGKTKPAIESFETVNELEINNISRSLETALVMEDIKQDIINNGLNNDNRLQLKRIANVALAGTGISLESAFNYLDKDQTTIIKGIELQQNKAAHLALEFISTILSKHKAKKEEEKYKLASFEDRVNIIKNLLANISDDVTINTTIEHSGVLTLNNKPVTNAKELLNELTRIKATGTNIFNKALKHRIDIESLVGILEKDLNDNRAQSLLDKASAKIDDYAKTIIRELKLISRGKYSDSTNKPTNNFYNSKPSLFNAVFTLITPLDVKPKLTHEYVIEQFKYTSFNGHFINNDAQCEFTITGRELKELAEFLFNAYDDLKKLDDNYILFVEDNGFYTDIYYKIAMDKHSVSRFISDKYPDIFSYKNNLKVLIANYYLTFLVYDMLNVLRLYEDSCYRMLPVLHQLVRSSPAKSNSFLASYRQLVKKIPNAKFRKNLVKKLGLKNVIKQFSDGWVLDSSKL